MRVFAALLLLFAVGAVLAEHNHGTSPGRTGYSMCSAGTIIHFRARALLGACFRQRQSVQECFAGRSVGAACAR